VRFGDAVPKDQPADADQDGVQDKEDQCPDTPAGTIVDTVGCTLDSDGDGVGDSGDYCPDTPAKAPVNSVGCLLDSDQDGVSDYADQCPGTPIGLPVEPTGCLKEIIKELPKRAPFGFDEAAVDPSIKPWLNRFSQLLQEHSSLDALIEGHADSSGAALYNQRLSEQRAKAVQDYIMEIGQLPADRFVVIGYGEDRPLVLNETPEGRRQNRRVDITLILRRPISDTPPAP
jgi:OOP family OmpA-OmpF porin